MQQEFIALDRPPEAGLQRQPLERMLVHLYRIELQIVLALLLGAVHRNVSVLQQRLLVMPVVGIDADADARRHVKFLAANQKRARYGIEYFLSHAGYLRGVGHILDQHHELVAALAPDGVRLAQAFAQPLGQLLQEPVSGIVTERVIDYFETVEIDEQHRRHAGETLRARQRLGQPLVEHRAVGQAGQRVVVSEKSQMQLRFLARNELADLAAYSGGDLDHLFVARAHAAAEQFNHAVKLTAHHERKRERALQSCRQRRRPAHERRFERQVGQPDRLAGRPHAAQQACLLAGGIDARRRQMQELGDFRRRNSPVLGVPHQAVVLGDGPARARRPAEALAQRLDDARNRFLDALRLGELYRHGILNVLAPFGALALAGLRGKQHRAVDHSVGIAQRRRRQADRDMRAVLAQAHGLDVREMLAALNGGTVAQSLLAFIGRHCRRQAADYFLLGPAENALGGGIPALDDAMLVLHDDRQRRHGDQCFEARRGLLQRVQRAFALADVGEHRHHAHRIARAVVGGSRRYADVDPRAVFSHPHGLDVFECLALEDARAVCLCLLHQMRRHQRRQPPQHFLPGPAEHALGGGVPALHFQIDVEFHDSERRSVDQRFDAIGRLL